jgi:hypothetical protein
MSYNYRMSWCCFYIRIGLCKKKLKLPMGGEDSHLNFISFLIYHYPRWEVISPKHYPSFVITFFLILCDQNAMSSMILVITMVQVSDCCLKIIDFRASQIRHIIAIIANVDDSSGSMACWLQVHTSWRSKEGVGMPIEFQNQMAHYTRFHFLDTGSK